jgi:hypothetical protein
LRKDATMARIGLLALLCVVPFLGTAALTADPPKEPDGTVESYLLAQTATLQAEMYLMQRKPAKAVEVLEAPLSKVSVNRKYLAVLRNAYRAYITELAMTNQAALAKKYEARLRILETNGLAEAPAARAAQAKVAAAPAVAAPAAPVPAALAGGLGAGPTSPASAIKARGKPYAADPFDTSNQAPRPAAEATTTPSKAAGLLAQAEDEFARRRYGDAWKLYEDAHRTDPNVTRGCHERWAYCKLHHVVEQINNTDALSCDWRALEREVRNAVALAPKLKKAGDGLLAQIEDRRGTAPPAAPASAEGFVRHGPRDAQGWEVAETQHFRILHKQSRAFAERTAQVAEQTRLVMHRKWFGVDGEPWEFKCQIFLHASARDYSNHTGQPSNFPGHSHIERDPSTGRIISRVIHLHCEDPETLVNAILPHEATHVVLAGRFGKAKLPRWADEGMAVLTEPATMVEKHRRNLSRCAGELFRLDELMQMQEYPQARRISAFYAQSVSLVSYLCGLRDPRTFARFMNDGLRDGYESALRRHYGIQGFSDLQGRWSQHVAADLRGPSNYMAGRLP